MTEFDQKYDIVDEKTPPNVPLRGHYKRYVGENKFA